MSAPPDFRQRLENTNSRQGQPVKLIAVVTGNPTPVVQWYREGMEIESSKDFQIAVEGQQHTLTINDPYPEDTGVFLISASNNFGKATSTAHIAIEAASSDEEFTMKTVTSTKKTVTQMESVQTKQSIKKTTKTSAISSTSAVGLPPGLNPTEAQKQFASVFSSVGGGLKKKKVKKQKVHSSAETEYETVAETETEAQTEVTTEVAFTETEAEMSSVEQVSSSKISPAVPRKPTAAELIKKPQLEIGSPLNKKTQIQGFRSVQAVTGKIHNVSKSKQVDIQINRESAQSLAYGQSKSYTGGVVRHVTAPTGPRSRDASAERAFDTDTGVNTDQEEMAVEQVEVEDGGEEVEVASIASTPEPTDIQSELEDVPQEPFAPRFDILPEDTGVVEGDIAVLQATISAWPEPYISWFREGATIEDCPDYQVSYEDGIAQLTIRNCYPDDAGTFTVSARNQMGSTSATCVLSVKSTSEYDREQQQDQFAGGYEESANDTPGSGVECSEPETTDNEELSRTRTSKVLSPVGEIDENASLNSPERRGPTSPEQVLNQAMEIVAEAEERLAATSPGAPQDGNLLLPSDSDAAPQSTSPVPGQPRFMTVPDRCILLQEGATQVFEACAPNCHVFWERDGKPIIGGYRVKTEENEKRGYAAITINMVFPEDAGEYVAVAVNRFGRVTHSVYFLTPEHYTAFMRKGGEVPTGLTDYTSSDNEPRGTTSDSDREGRPMSRGDLNKIKKGVGIKQSASSLTRRTPSPGPRAVSKSPMRGASPSGKGLQNVDAKDLAKVYKPVFLVKAINQEILEGKSARINIRVTGRPPPVMSWFRNGEPVIQDEVRRVTIQENGVESYILDATSPVDSAEYTIMAENAGGRAVSSCKLTILPAEEAQRPKILDKPVSTKVNAGESVRLEVFAVGRPTPEICWLKDNQLLQPDKHTNFQFEGVDGHGLLIVEKADKSHDGWYTATAVNKAGRDLCRCKLTVAAEVNKDEARNGRNFKTGKGMKKKADASPGRHTGKLTRAPEEFDEKDLYDATQQQKPFFKQKIESIKTTTLGGAHFECRLIPIGDPTMKVQWLLDDKPLEHANRIQTMFEFGYTSLDILNCYPRDTGVISCRATNAHGGTETSATLIVKEDRSTKFAQKEGRAMELISQKEKEMRPPSESPTHSVSPTKEMSDDVIAPQIVSVPEDIETAEGQTMRFHVRATGNPPPKLEWYLNGQQIRKSKRFQLWYDGLHHLEINPARAYDTGSLVAVAVNKVGQAQASCTVDVEPLGDLRSNLKRVDGSSPDAALRAMRMNRKVEGEKQAEVFEEVQLRRTSMNKSPTKDPRKSAAYDADLRAKFKNVRTEEHQMTAARVSVQKKMKHYDQVEHEELLKKTKRELEHWETPEDTPTPTSSKKEGLSHAINVEIPDFSGIKVEAKDEFRPPVITKRLTDTKFDSDQDAKIQVKFNGMPEPELMWFQNGEELAQTERKYWKFIDNQTCELNILKIQKSDEGQYAARVANRAGEELSTCVISITEIKRKILEGPRSQEWNAENTAKFEVVVSHKDMDGEWYKDGVAVDQNDKFVAEDLGSGRRRLTIYNLIKIDEGIYEYVYGGDRAAATLTVHAKPISIVQNLADQVVVASESATFECTLSDVTTDGTWFKNGQPLEQSERHFTAADGVKQILLIENITAEDIGEYAFAIDEVHTIAQLNLMSNEQQIQIVQHLQAASCLEGSAAEFVCAVEPEQYSNGKWFKNGVELQIDNSRMSYNQVQGGFKELVIRNCTANDNGAYTFVAGTQETVAELQVTEIEILEPLKNQSVDLGGEVLFETLLSHANVQGVWFKNNVPFKISDKSQVFIDDNVQALYLRELTAEDAGIYSFRAGNKITECELEVVSFDVFKMGLQDLRMKSSETAVFHAELNVDLEGAWFRDGQQLQMNDRVKSSSSGLHRELVIEDLQRADEGIYTYSTGNADSSATLYVEVAYIIPKNFKDIVVQETSSAEFECEVTKPNLETHWFKDGVEIDPTNDKYEILTQGLSYKLRINNCTINDNCEVVFLAEDESVAANLQVKPIDIVEDINDEVQAEGKDVTFCCKTSAACQPRWSKDNMILKPRDNKYQIKSDGVMNYLTVKNVNMEDAGSYTCHVGNNESNATLYVEVSQINFVSETAINVQASVEQEMAQIEFQVNKEGVKGKWFHNGIDVNIDNVKYNYVVDRTYHKLIVKQLNVADSGDYTFEANKNLTATASLRVEAKPIAPQWIRQLANAKSELMGNAHFEVEVVGAPTPVVSFYKNGTQITESSKYNLKSSGNVHSLDINCCTEADVCQYTCTAKNSAGSTMTSAQLSIVEAYDMQYEQPAAEQMSVEPPVITRKFESQTSKAGARVVFECEYVGTEPNVRWSKNGNEIQQNNGIQIVNDMHYTALVITSAQHLISGGDYAVEIFNAAGSASNKATLTVQGSPPEVAERPEGGDWQIGESMRLVAKITGEPAPQVHWEYNGKEVNSQRFKIYEANGYAFLELENCEGNDSGKYTVVGENELGQAKWTVTIACRNLTPDATGRPQSASSARSVEVITQKRTTSDGQQVVTNEEVAVATPSPPQANSPPVASPPKIASPVDVPVQKKATPKLDLSPKPQKKVSPADVTSPTSPDFVKFDVEEERKKSKVRKTPLKLNIPEKKQDNENKLKRAPEAMTPLPEQDKPEFIVCPESTDITIGSEAEIACRIAGNPTPDVQWYKGKWGKLAAVGRISIGFNVQSGVSTLNIKKVQKPDKGLYRCVATNKNGSAEAEFTLNVCEKQQTVEKVDRFSLKTKPKVEKETVSEFDAVKMLRDVDPKEYEKYANHFGVKDFRHLLTTYEELKPEIENDDIEMPEMLLTPESAISMVEEEELWEKAVETIGTKPVDVLQDIRDVVVATHGDAIFEAEIRINVPGIDVKWFKEETPLHEGDKYSMSREGDVHSLLIRNVNSDDEGDYRVEAGKQQSSATLKVVQPVPVTPPPIQEKVEAPVQAQDEPIEIVGALEDKEGYALSDVTLQAVLDKAGVDYEWYHNDQLIQADKDVEIEDQGECYSLTFKNCPMDRAGKIEFRAARGRVTTACNLTLIEPQLQFVVPLEDQEVGEKEAAEFTVKLSKPIKYLEWTLNTEKLKSGGNITMKADKKNLDHTLYLDEVTKDMEGELAVEAEGVRSTAQLTVTKDLKFTGKLKDTDVVEGQDAVFEATVSNADVPVQWFKNGIEVTPDDSRLKIKTEGRKRFFTIPNCSKADEAEYSCKLGDKTSSAALRVDFAPVKFTKQIMDTGAAEGGVATFECEVSRDEPVQWFKNGKEKIMDGPKYTMEVDGLVRRLKINDVSYNDEAKFACQVGDAKTVASLAVQTVAIEFVVALEDKTVSEGERAEFNVELNVPDVKPIQWFQNGIEMSPKSGIEIKSVETNHMFAIANVSMLDTSEIMFNAGGSRTACQLKVTQTPLKFVKVLAENAEAENKMASFELECELNRQNANVKWYLNDKEIFPSRKFAMAVDGAKRILTISDITKDDEGIYHCQADDQKTQTNLKVIPADVKFMTSLEDCSAFERDSFTFEVEISHVNMEGEWFKDGQKISSGKNTDLDVKGTAHLLTINDCSKSDAGQYKFVVEGKSCECAFTVKDTPAKFVKRLQDESSTEKEEIALSCEVNRPTAEVVWKHNGEPIVADDRVEIVSDGRRRALVIKSVVQADEGDYSCDAGDDETTCTLCVGGRDIRFTKKMIDQEIIEGEKVTFELGLSHDDVEGQWSVNGNDVKNSDDVEITCSGRKHTLTLENTKVAQTGPVIFKIASGPKCEARLEVIEAPCTFIAPINDITALENENAVFECQVSKADAEVTWYKGRTKIHMSDKYEMVAVEYKRSLIVKSAGFDDESQFAAQVGENKCAAKLTITSKVITLSDCFEDQNKTVGETIELTVKASEMGEDAKWMINGIQLKADDNVEFFVDGPVYGLRIKNATLDMAGDVTVSVLNAKHTAALNITDGPASFIKKLEDVSIENKSKSLELTAELNRGNVNVTWLRDGAEIVPSRKFDIVKRKAICTLVIADITKEDGAAYTCDCGDEQTVSNVTVVDQNITVVGTFPEEKVVIERETLDIEVEISHEDVEVTWELVREGKDNEVMVASKSCELSSFRTVHNLKVFNCELDLTGTMLFKAGNLVKEIKVVVKEPGARFTKRLADQSATETDAAVFECEISRANADVEWFLNDVKVEESDKFVIESSNRRRVLTINNCSSADEGKVRCSSEDDETLAELQIEGRDIKILKKLSDQEVTEGEEVTFELDVNYADIKGKWTVNDVAVEEGDAYEMAVKGKKQILKIKSTTSDNAGLVVWTSGKTKGTANLSVLEAPAAFIVPLKDTTAEEKSVCTLEAELNRGNVKTRWLKDRRVPIQTSDKYEIIDDGKIRKLVIKDVTYDDEGAYTCDAETAKSNMALTVCARDIKLTAPMRDSTAAEKGTGVMSFDLSHSEVSTTWFRNGQKLAKSRLIEMTCEPCDNGFRYSLNIKEIGQDDGGVIAFNAEGIQGEANLEVCATPVDIIDELKRTVCRQGDNITLSVKVSDPLPVGQWFINGVKLARSDRMAIANDAGVHTLKIKNVTTDEMGEAVFVCNNARTSADVIVKDPKVTFSQKLIDQSATEKAVVEFETEVNRINAQIEWVDAAGNVIEESGRFEFVAEGRKRRLIIEGVLLADEGYIKARAAPEFDPLDFANKVRDVQTKEGGEALFDCDVNQPDQAIEWFYDGNKLEAGSKYEFVSDKFRKSLIVKNCQPEDMGFYKAELSNCKSCEAELTVGAEAKANPPRPSYQPEASQEKPNEVSAKLTVKARDIKIRRHLQDQECFEGESVEFQCETSFSDVTPHWTCNGVLLKENGQTVIFEQSGARQRLILKEVQGTQAGTIEFYGKTKANLHVIEQPVDFTEEMEPVSVFEKETAKFHAKVSRANAKVKWFKGRRMLKEGGARYEMIADGCNRLLIIKKSEFNDEKDYTCSCDDAIVTAKLTVNPRDIKMVKPLEDITCNEKQDAIFECELSHDEVETSWYRDGAKIIKSGQIIMESDGRIARLIIKNVNQEDDDQCDIQCRAEDAVTSAILTVKPTILEILDPLEEKYLCPEGEEFTFQVRVSQPGVAGEWYMNGNQIRRSVDVEIKPAKGDVHKIIFKKMHKGLMGQLKFRITKNGASCQANIKVKGPDCKVVQKLPEELMGQAGQPMVFEVKLNRAPDQDASGWKKDGVFIDPFDPKYKVEEKDGGKHQRLIIPKPDPTDAGFYAFDTGDEETICKALVKEQDAIFDEKLPSELKLKTEQENAKLQCSTNIAKNVELKWTKDGVEVTGDDYERIDEGCIHILQIKQVGSQHAGRYQCELVKSGDKTYCNVAVEDSPFQSDPVTKSIFVGESAEFEVMVKDNASKVIWSVNGKTGEPRFEDSESGFTRKFKVSAAELSDNGPIVAVVEGRESKPVSCDFNVYDHLVVTKKPENWSGKENAEVTMVAEVNKNAKVTWYNNKRAISPDDEKYTISSEGCVHSIKFKAGKEDDGATIEATFGAELDEYVSTSGSLDVACGMSPAKIDVGDADREIVRGERAEIAFDLRGKPEPEITVTNQDRNKEQTVVQSEEVKIQRLIVIESVTNEDAGTYTIVAKNSEGSDNAALHVRVVARPDAPEGITVTKMTNDACGFCWKAPNETGGLPIIMYEIGWRYAEDEAWTELKTKDETTNYFLMGLKKDSAIELKVAAVNRAGTGAWSEQVGPHKVSDGVFPPGYPVNVKVDKAGVTAKAVPMSWDEPASDGGAPVTGYEIEKQLDGMDGWEPCGKTADKKFTVEDPAVKDGKAYKFRVKAVNEAGVSGGSEPTELINVEDPNLRPGAPSKVHADNPSTDSIDVSWKVPPSEQPITGYVVEKLKSGATEWEKCGTASGDQQAITVVELEPGTAYNFRAFAENESGMSHPSEMSNACTTLDGAAPDVEPQLIPEQTHYQANRGEPFNAKVKVLGRPQCEVEWKRGSEAWFEYARYGGGFAQISIPAAQGTDSGEYTVTATNRAGSASATITVQIIDVPAEPVNLDVKPQNGGICFSWNAPKNDGGEQIAGYVVEYKDAESDWTEGANPVDCEHVFDDLPKGGTFKFRVAAYNKIGQGAFAEFGNEIGTAGGVVTNLHVTSTTDDSVSLAWDPPKNEKVTAALGYTVERLGEGMDPSLWVVHNPGSPAKSCKYTCNHLEFMSRWQFRVKCISEFGPGEPCEPTDWITVEMDKTPPTVDLWEGAEDGLSVKVTQNRMIMPAKITGRPQPEVSWVKGDYPLSVDSRVSIANTDKMSTFTMADLTRADSGEYTVIAENENGTAEKKVMVNVMDTPAAPEDFDISDITNKSAVLVWKAPLDDGGTPIRNYCVEKREVGRSVWGKITSEIAPDVTTYEVTRLLEGREYEFRVSARNDLGLGDGALSAPIIANYLFEVPEQCDPPTILETSITKSGMTAKWNAPEFDGGSPVTGYWLEMSNPDSTRWSKVNRKPIEAGKRTYKVANLKEGREYIFRVCAENLAGRGAWSDPSEPECALDPLSPPGRPGKPEVLAVGDTTASLKWKAPKEGAESIEHYVLEMRKRPQTDMEAEREAAAAAEAERKMKAMTWISRLPEYKEVEIAAPEIVLQVELNEGINDKIHWKKDGQRLKQGNGIEFISEGNIRILKITKTVSESDQGTYTAKVGGKKCECQVSVSLFMNDNNNVNSNNNISKLKLEEPKESFE